MPLRRDIPMAVTIRNLIATDLQLGDLPLIKAGSDPVRLEFCNMAERIANRTWDSVKNAVAGNVIEMVIVNNNDGSPAVAADKAAADKAAADKAAADAEAKRVADSLAAANALAAAEKAASDKVAAEAKAAADAQAAADAAVKAEADAKAAAVDVATDAPADDK